MDRTVPRAVPAYTIADIPPLSAGGAHRDSKTCIAGNVTPYRETFNMSTSY